MNNNAYEAYVLLPGLEHMLQLIQGEIDRMKARLGGAPVNGNGAPRGRAQDLHDFAVGLQNGGAKYASAQKRYWSNMTPEERSAEMKRRGMTERRKQDALARFDGKSKAVSGYWASMSPDERAAEMRRRQRVAASKRSARDAADVEKLHPRDPRSPRHAAYIEKLRKSNLARWAGYSPEERAARVAKSQGRAA